MTTKEPGSLLEDRGENPPQPSTTDHRPPATADVAPARTESAPVETRLDHPRSVLLVEGDAGVTKLVEMSLAESQVHCVATAEEGLAALQRQGNIEFIVTDLFLPGIDGIELIRRARHTVSGSSIPILMLTAKKDEETLVEAFHAGADDFMAKPFSLAELRIRVNSIHMRQQRASDMNPLTRLPGNAALKREIEVCIAKTRATGQAWAIAYIDLDHFKAFNDARGFDRGDHVIQLVADVLRHYTRGCPPGDCFIGHVGGDDFLAIVPLERVDELSARLHADFSDAVAPLFSEEELLSGKMSIVDRQGNERQVPLLSISIGAVNTAREGVTDLRTVAHIAAEVKSVAKATPGNSFFLDRRSR